MRRLLCKTNYAFSYRNFGRLAYDPFEKKNPPTEAINLKETV
jgi:hypothetical protein